MTNPGQPYQSSITLVSRRRFLVGMGAAAAAAAFLAACGDDEEEATPAATSTEPPSTATAAPTAAAPMAAATELPPGFVFTDARGITVELPERPVRIVAQVSAAAALWDFGIRPVGVFGPQRNEDGSNGPQVGDVDLSTVTSLGEAWGEFDLEAFAELQPDLLISTAYAGADPLWYVPAEAQPVIDQLCPSVGIEVQATPVVEIIQRFEDLARELGADLEAPEVVVAKDDFAAAETALKDAIAAKPGITVMGVSANEEFVYVINPRLAHDMLWFQSLGMDVLVPPIPEGEWWEALSWEQVAAHDDEVDLILVDQRTQSLTAEQMAERELWPRVKAVAAGQIGPWYSEPPTRGRALRPPSTTPSRPSSPPRTSSSSLPRQWPARPKGSHMTPTLLTDRPTSLLVPAPIEDATRREFITGVGAAALAAAFLAACGEGDAEEEADASALREFVDDAGRTVLIPARPQRIVATHGRNAGALVLALGGPLVGIATRNGVVHSAITGYFDVSGIETVGEYSETDIEKVATLRPDVIVHQAFDGQVSLDPPVLAQLEEIAPVVGFDVFQPVDRVMAKVVELIGTEEAEQRFAEQRGEYEEVLDELRGVLGDRWSEMTVSSLFFGGLSGGAISAGGPEINATNNILSSLGVSWVPVVMEAAENGQFLGGISFERLAEFDADLLLVSAFGDPEFIELPLWDSLRAVRAGQVISLPDDLIGTHYPNYIATARFLIDELAGRELSTDLVASHRSGGSRRGRDAS